MKKTLIAALVIAVAYGGLVALFGHAAQSTVAHAAEVQSKQLEQIDAMSK